MGKWVPGDRIDPRLYPKTPKDTLCGYCQRRTATGYDHVVPYSYGGPTKPDNLFPCCRRCNSILGNKLFNSIEEKRIYVKQWLIRKRGSRHDLPNLPDGIHREERASEVLQPEVSIPRLASEETSKDGARGDGGSGARHEEARIEELQRELGKLEWELKQIKGLKNLNVAGNLLDKWKKDRARVWREFFKPR